MSSDLTNDNGEYEEVCAMCRRPESVTGRLIKMPGEICVCSDCMQKTFDTMSSWGMDSDMSLPPGMVIPGAGNANTSSAGTESDSGAEDGGESSEGSDDKDKKNPPPSNPNIQMLNLSDLIPEGLFSMVPQNQKLKKKKKKKKAKDVDEGAIDIKNIPPPHMIKALLDEYVVGQEYAKKVMSVAVYNHYKRVNSMENMIEDDSGVEIEKSNMLMIGPTGSGKTYLVRTLARLLNVPLAITDATSLTEAGYIGDDIESVVSKLLAAADNDVEEAERGIIFIDEIDKLAKKKNTNQRDVSGEAVQQGMLKLLEGSEIEVPVGASSKNAMVPMTTIDTSNILFVCGGAFPDLDEIIKERLNKSSSMGFVSDLRDKYDKEENILTKVEVEDLRKFGMIPEFIGRMPVIYALEKLNEEMLVRILKEPKNAIVKQYQKLLEYDEVKLEFEDEALYSIAKRAKEKELGARALRSIIEDLMLDIMYEIPKDPNIGTVIITKDYVDNNGAPQIIMRSQLPMHAGAESAVTG